MSRVFRTRPVTALVVSNNGASAVTSTDWLVCPISSCRSSDRRSRVLSVMPLRTNFLNPDDSTETEYGPGFRKLTSKYPVWLVVALSETLVAVLVTTTAAPGTTEFCGSTTLPVILPRDSCARQTVERQSSNA